MVSLLESRFAAADSIQPPDTNLCDILAFSTQTGKWCSSLCPLGRRRTLRFSHVVLLAPSLVYSIEILLLKFTH